MSGCHTRSNSTRSRVESHKHTHSAGGGAVSAAARASLNARIVWLDPVGTRAIGASWSFVIVIFLIVRLRQVFELLSWAEFSLCLSGWAVAMARAFVLVERSSCSNRYDTHSRWLMTTRAESASDVRRCCQGESSILLCLIICLLWILFLRAQGLASKFEYTSGSCASGQWLCLRWY